MKMELALPHAPKHLFTGNGTLQWGPGSQAAPAPRNPILSFWNVGRLELRPESPAHEPHGIGYQILAWRNLRVGVREVGEPNPRAAEHPETVGDFCGSVDSARDRVNHVGPQPPKSGHLLPMLPERCDSRAVNR